MIEQQPAAVGQQWHSACANLQALPCALFEWSGLHHNTVFAPEDHVGRVADVDVAKWSVTIVRRTAQHSVHAIDLLREEHAIAVERQERVLALEEFLEVESIADADGRTVVAIAPSDPVAVFDPSHTRVIFVVGMDEVSIAALELDRFVSDVPVDAVLAESHKDVHLHRTVVATEDTGIAAIERHYRTVENAVGAWYMIASDDRIG